MQTQTNHINIAFIGKAAVSKTCIIKRFLKQPYAEEYIPTIFENYSEHFYFNGNEYIIDIWDTAGQEEFDHFKEKCFPQANVFVLVFSVLDPKTIENVKESVKEIKKYGKAPILLVGSKIDLRTGKDEQISNQKGLEIAKDIKAKKYLECSAKTDEGISEIFESAVKIAIENKQRPQKSNSIREMYNSLKRSFSQKSN